MKSVGRQSFIIAVIFSALLIMSSGAQASSRFGLDGSSAPQERQIGLFQEAIQWLGGAWNGLVSVFELSQEPPTSQPTEECTTNCGDAGPGLDPIG